MDGTEDGQIQGAPLEAGQSSDAATQGTSKNTPTYTEADITKAISDALAKQGREHKKALDSVTAEKDTFKAQFGAKESELTDIAEERKSLQSQIDELASDDPDKFNITRKDRELRERETTLKATAQAMETEKQAWGDTVKMAKDTLRETAIWEISGSYEGGDPVKLKELCVKFDINSEEKIREVADTLWAPKVEKPQAPVIKADSGVTSGGGTDWRSLPPQQQIAYGLKQKK